MDAGHVHAAINISIIVLSLEHLNAIRQAEIDKIVPLLPQRARILEIGAGTGHQALRLKQRGFDVTAIEVANSNYATRRIFPIVDYDGRTIPLPDQSVDVVFSSNVLEHVTDLSCMHTEIRRVLAPNGYCIHVLPTHTWRLWTTLTSYLEAISFFLSSVPQLVPRTMPREVEMRRLRGAWYSTVRHTLGLCLPRRHGERGNTVSELWLFHPRWWRGNFLDNGFVILRDEPMGLFYTGEALLGLRLGLAKREWLARVLGSSCHLFHLMPSLRRSAHPADSSQANSRVMS